MHRRVAWQGVAVRKRTASQVPLLLTIVQKQHTLQMEHQQHVVQHALQQDCIFVCSQACCLSSTSRSPACLSTLAGAHRLGCIVGILLLRRGAKQQLAQLENGLRDCEVAQFRWWAWATQYRRRKVCLFSYGMSILSIVSIGVTYSSAVALSVMALSLTKSVVVKISACARAVGNGNATLCLPHIDSDQTWC